jgi:aryl-alcohol dehydrogenase-like predicted oxidoreductase
MEHRSFGTSGLNVSPLGLGAGTLGDPGLSEKSAERLLHLALDLGVTLIDTARSYGRSEERIGKYLQGRRNGVILSTKVGYGIPGTQDWTYDCVARGIDEALGLLKTDVIDIVHLHSCPLETLLWGEPTRALEDALHDGKIWVAAYSGENEALGRAIESGRFGSVQHSVNICDQRAIDGSIQRTRELGMGVIAKRPLANAPWLHAECPKGSYVEEYWWRWDTMKLDTRGIAWEELAIRFAAFTPGVHSCIVGTTREDHLRRNIEAVSRGPLPEDHVAEIRNAFACNDPGWWIGQL